MRTQMPSVITPKEALKLKPFQERGRDFLAARRYALLADEMRLGKTAQAITAAEQIGVRLVLVICPAIAQTHWKKEFDRWWPGQHGLEVISYDQARTHRATYSAVEWDLLIIDEAHYVKSPSAARTKAILGKGGIARSAGRVWALTGTPAPNNVAELWTLMFTFGATRMDYDSFLLRYCNIDPFSGRIRGTKKGRIPEIQTALRKIMRRNLKKDVAPELPPFSLEPWYVTPNPEYVDIPFPVAAQDKLDEYSKLEAKLKAVLSGLPPDDVLKYLDSNIAELATLRRMTGLLKLPDLLATIQFELDNGILDKCVIFGYHQQGMKTAALMLKAWGYKAELIYGGTPQAKRDKILARFNRPKGTQVLLAQILAAGTAIDLSAAHEGFMLERDWVPGNNAQALERMGGYRQTKPVTVRDVIIPDSVDDILSGVLRNKMRDISDIYGEE